MHQMISALVTFVLKRKPPTDTFGGGAVAACFTEAHAAPLVVAAKTFAGLVKNDGRHAWVEFGSNFIAPRCFLLEAWLETAVFPMLLREKLFRQTVHCAL